MKIAFVGNPNCGKSTLFNLLTGANQVIGNWPGVTVEKKEGYLKEQPSICVVDLPGIYSLSPYSLEEVVSRQYLLTEQPDLILNIVDGTNLERNLYLTTQLLTFGIPVVVAINMMDLVRKQGDSIDLTLLSQHLDCPVVEISALKNDGIPELLSLFQQTNHPSTSFPVFSETVEATLAQIIQTVVPPLPEKQQRFYAIKLFERDMELMKQFDFDSQVGFQIEHLILRCETELQEDNESIIIGQQYQWIDTLMAQCFTKKNKTPFSISDRIDRIVTHRFLGLPIFAAVMFIVYFISVTTVGTMATDWANEGLFGDGWTFMGRFIPGIPVLLGNGLDAIGTASWLQNLILDGIVAGVGAVLGFVPQMLILFLFLSFLEACGYMARIAFMMDQIFRKFGLSGKSFIPMIIGTGCSVPGIMASRTIESESDRRMTIMTTSFIPCGAKLPLIALISGALFGKAWWVAPSAYFIGILSVLFSGLILKKTAPFAAKSAPFVMELPAYHWPAFSNLCRNTWERSWSFIQKAGTIILLSTIVLWFASNYTFHNGTFEMVSMEESILAMLGTSIAWIFAPLGWGNWQTTVAAITGLIAKENVVGTMGVLYGYQEVSENGQVFWSQMSSNFTAASGYSFLLFNLLCAPCFAAIGAMKRELNHWGWLLFAVAYQCTFAYGMSFIIYQFAVFISTNTFTIGTIIALASLVILFIWLWLPLPNRKDGLKNGYHHRGYSTTHRRWV